MSLSRTDYECNMAQAIVAVRGGMPCATAARNFNLNRTTLLYRVTGKSRKAKKGPECVLGDSSEAILVEWIKANQRAKFPITADELKISVNQLVKTLGIESPFKDDKPGKKWLKLFFERHTNVCYRTAEYLSQARASVTPDTLKKWFHEVKEYLVENDFMDVLEDPRRVFNCDESGFYLNPKGKKVLASKGERDIHLMSKNCDKENYTVLVNVNAAGEMAPSMVVFALDRISRDLANSVPSTWAIGRSKNGWMCAETFYEYIANVFNNWLIDFKIPKPVVMFLDGHTSHLSIHLSKFCSENKIILISLYPNSTHICQPLDVSVFKPLKTKWSNDVKEWRLENSGEKLTRIDFSRLLEKSLNKLSVETISNGFKHCGLYPFTDTAIPNLFNRKPRRKNKTESQNGIKTYQEKTTLCVIENMIGPDKLLSFQNNSYSTEDSTLYQMWKNLSQKYNQTGELDIDTSDDLIQTTSPSLNTTVGSASAFSPPECSTPLLLSRNTSLNELPLSNNDQTNTPTTSPLPMIIDEVSSNSLPQFMVNIPLNLTTPLTDNLPISTTPPIAAGSTSALLANISHTLQTNSSDSHTSFTPPKSTAHLNGGKPKDLLNIPSPFKKALFWPGETDQKGTNKKRKREFLPATITSKSWQAYHEKQINRKEALLNEKKEKQRLRELKKSEKEKAAAAKRELRETKRLLKQSLKRKRRETLSCSDDDSHTDGEVRYESSTDTEEFSNEENESDFENNPAKSNATGISTRPKKIKNKQRTERKSANVTKKFPVPEVEISDWVIVEFQVEGAKKTKKFIGQVVDVKKGKLYGNFLRSKFTREDTGFVYQYPNVKDISVFSFYNIIQKLNNPTKYGRGLLKFDIHANNLV